MPIYNHCFYIPYVSPPETLNISLTPQPYSVRFNGETLGERHQMNPTGLDWTSITVSPQLNTGDSWIVAPKSTLSETYFKVANYGNYSREVQIHNTSGTSYSIQYNSDYCKITPNIKIIETDSGYTLTPLNGNEDAFCYYYSQFKNATPNSLGLQSIQQNEIDNMVTQLCTIHGVANDDAIIYRINGNPTFENNHILKYIAVSTWDDNYNWSKMYLYNITLDMNNNAQSQLLISNEQNDFDTNIINNYLLIKRLTADEKVNSDANLQNLGLKNPVNWDIWQLTVSDLDDETSLDGYIIALFDFS